MGSLRALNMNSVNIEEPSMDCYTILLRLTALTRLEARAAVRTTSRMEAEEFGQEAEAGIRSWLGGLRKLTSLQHLDLGNRKAETGARVDELTALTYLNLDGNPIRGEGHAALVQTLPQLTNLQHLSLSRALRRAAPLSQLLVAAMALQQLTHLDVSRANAEAGRTPLGEAADERSAAVGQSLAFMTELRSLVWTHMSAALLPRIGMHLNGLTALSSLNLESAKMQAVAKDAAWDTAWLALLGPSLRRLSLKETGLWGRTEMSDYAIRQRHNEVVEHVGALTLLTTLNLSCNAFTRCRETPQVHDSLSQLLTKLTGLQELKLRDCALTTPALEATVQSLQRLLHLRTLDLGKNEALGTAAMQALWKHVSRLMGLHELRLDSLPSACSNVVGSPGDLVRRALGRCTCEKCDQSKMDLDG